MDENLSRKKKHTHRDLISPPVNVIAVISHFIDDEDFHFDVAFAYLVLPPLLLIFDVSFSWHFGTFFFFFRNSALVTLS